MRHSILVGFAAISALVGVPAKAATAVFTENDFAPGSFAPTFQYVTNPANSFAATQCANCGSGGSAALQITPDFADTTFDNLNQLGLIDASFTYDPAVSGAIGTIDASVVKDFTVPNLVNYNNVFRPLIEQNGDFYSAAISGPELFGPGTTGLLTISMTGLTAADFDGYDPLTGIFDTSAHPDFTTGLLTFGLLQNLGSSGFPGVQGTLVYDDYRVAINGAVPEPSAWALMIAGFGVVGTCLRRRPQLDFLPRAT